jgi:hypothetical protein
MKHTFIYPTLICLAATQSGCRVGNNTVTTDNNPDKISGYYDTVPQSLMFCATPAGNTSCKNVATNLVPSMISAEMTQPTALIVQDLDTGDAVFTAPRGGKTALPIWVQPDKTLYYANSSSEDILWKDPACTSKLYLEEDGAIMAGPANPVAGSTRATSGRVQLRVRVTEIFQEIHPGACGSTLTLMSNCYQDVTQCGGADSGSNQQLQTQVQTMFNSYIQAGAISASDIPNLSNISYEVQYQ